MAASSTTVTRPAVSLMAANGVTEPGLDAKEFAQELGGAERKPPGGAKEPVQRFQLDRGVLARHDQVWGAFFVAQEQVLGMATRNRAAQLAAFLDGEYRRMGDGLVGDAEPIQIGEKLVRRGRHGRYLEHDPEKWIPVLRKDHAPAKESKPF